MNKFAQLWSDIVECWGDSSSQYLVGALKTIELAVVATAIGCIIGLACGIVQTIPCTKNDNIVKRILLGIVKAIVRIYVEVFRGTPMIIQAIFIFYAIPYFTDGAVNLEVTLAAYLVVSINTGAYISEIVRGGIISVDKGQYEGAQSIGMNHFQIMVKVVMPQVLRNILPAVSNEFVINIKDTSVLNVIGVAELFYQATVASKATFAIFETYAIVCVIYFILTFTITRLLRLVERLLDGKKDYTICGSQSDSASMIKISEGETPND